VGECITREQIAEFVMNLRNWDGNNAEQTQAEQDRSGCNRTNCKRLFFRESRREALNRAKNDAPKLRHKPSAGQQGENHKHFEVFRQRRQL
jgi:hypothetical protein